MTVEQLVAEARVNRTPGSLADSMTKSQLREALVLTLGIVLESCDYENELRSTPAIVARALAALAARVEDSKMLH